MRNVDWAASRPTEDAISEMWEQLDVFPVDIESEALFRGLRKLREERGKGGAEYACFSVSQSHTFDWYASRNRLSEIDFYQNFLTREVVRDSLRSLDVPERLLDESTREVRRGKFRGWTMEHPLALAGRWATLIYEGGPHVTHPESPDEGNSQAQFANRLAQQLVADLFENRFADLGVFVTHDPWSMWFRAAAWDFTWVVLDKKMRRVHVLCLTDKD